jgi:hypothetical protein
MDTDTNSNGAPARPILLGLGAAAYTISFFLPAVADGNNWVTGWFCAWVALAAVARPYEWLSLPLFASGLINPLTLGYLALRMLGKRPRVRRGLAIAALSFIPLSWIVIASQLRFGPGHVVWVAGLAMVLAPEAIRPGLLGKR